MIAQMPRIFKNTATLRPLPPSPASLPVPRSPTHAVSARTSVQALYACVVASTLFGSCGQASHRAAPAVRYAGADLDSLPARDTRAVLAGPRCHDTECTCLAATDAPDAAGLPDEKQKRYEIRLGPAANELWLQLGEHHFYKSSERTEACYYVDLGPGQYPLALRGTAHAEQGLAAAVRLREFGAAATTWYESFQFACGSPGPCTSESLAAQKTELRAVPRGIFATCGSTRMRHLQWETKIAPDGQDPTDLAFTATVDVYAFLPARQADADCTAMTPHDGAARE